MFDVSARLRHFKFLDFWADTELFWIVRSREKKTSYLGLLSRPFKLINNHSRYSILFIEMEHV